MPRPIAYCFRPAPPAPIFYRSGWSVREKRLTLGYESGTGEGEQQEPIPFLFGMNPDQHGVYPRLCPGPGGNRTNAVNRKASTPIKHPSENSNQPPLLFALTSNSGGSGIEFINGGWGARDRWDARPTIIRGGCLGIPGTGYAARILLRSTVPVRSDDSIDRSG